MKQSDIRGALACCLRVGSAGAAQAGAPQPDQRPADVAHVCEDGAELRAADALRRAQRAAVRAARVDRR
jgi:hypothetical protein